MSEDGTYSPVISRLTWKVIAFWADRFILLVTGLVVCLVAEPLLSRAAEYVAELLEPHVLFIKIFAVAIASATTWHVATLPGGFYMRQFRHCWKVPPIWVLALVGCVIYLPVAPARAVSSISAPEAGDIWTSFAFVALCGPALAYVLRWITHPTKSNPTHRKQLTPAAVAKPAVLKDEEYHSWLESENPISEVKYDFFDAATVARRISRLLVQSPPKNVGLIGPFGSGKSSICDLVCGFLLNPDTKNSSDGNQTSNARKLPIICRVEGWGFREGSAALHILKSMVSRLSCEVDCISLAKLPNEYVAVLREIPSGFSRVATGWLSRPEDPEAILLRFDDLLERAGLRFLVILEDLDRNADANQGILCDEIYPLLDRMCRLERVSFLFAVGHHGSELANLVRLAGHLEAVPALLRALLQKS